MSYNHRKIDRILLAAALFTVSGAVLAYNLHTAGGGELAVSLSELAAYGTQEASAVSDSAAANLMARDSVYTAAAPSAAVRGYELLDPIVTRP